MFSPVANQTMINEALTAGAASFLLKPFDMTSLCELLKSLLETDEGASRIGEVALVSSSSPINKENILRDIARLVAVPSIEGEPEEGAPFGKEPKKALELGLEIAEELGLGTRNCENYIGYAELPGENEEKYIATVTHLDVVPVGEGWTKSPFEMWEKDGYIIGRGVMDDKGPSVVCLYALKYLKDKNKRHRITISIIT